MMRSFLLAATLFPFALLAQSSAEFAPIWVRLGTPVKSGQAAAESVSATVIATQTTSSGIIIPMGSVLTGRTEVAQSDRRKLRLVFDKVQVKNVEYPMRALVSEVDNAREKVTPDGTILALDALRKRPGKVEVLLLAAAYAHPAAAAFMEGAKFALREVEKPAIHYPAGTDLALKVEIAPQLPSDSTTVIPAKTVIPSDLAGILQALPSRTETYGTHRNSDWTNVAFAGDRDDLIRAFASAGWKPADHLSVQADLKVFLALAHQHSYQHAPVSRLLLAGREPDLVFQKQNNTFAKRHHIRIWSSDHVWEGRPLWIAAATHDIGIEFSAQSKTFTHRIDSNIDLEREKVADDLIFAGVVRIDHQLPRPEIPAESQNATGTSIRTDGVMRVLVLSSR